MHDAIIDEAERDWLGHWMSQIMRKEDTDHVWWSVGAWGGEAEN